MSRRSCHINRRRMTGALTQECAGRREPEQTMTDVSTAHNAANPRSLRAWDTGPGRWPPLQQKPRFKQGLSRCPPVAIMATVPKPYSSPPRAAATRTSRPERIPPSTLSTTRSRSELNVSVCSGRDNLLGIELKPAFQQAMCSCAPAATTAPAAHVHISICSG